MKTPTFVLLICALLWAPVMNSREPDSMQFLKLRGKILCATRGAVTIQVLCEGKTIDSITLTSHRCFALFLQPARLYTLRIRKHDTYPQVICVDTRHFALTDYEPYEFSFQTNLVTMDPGLKFNEELRETPIAIVYYDTRHNKFNYNKAYTSRIKRSRLHKQTCSR